MTDAGALATTPLSALHRELGARMVPFAGYEMPVQYPAGILKEHLHTRSAASLFDVSHMGQVRLAGGDPVAALERLVPGDVRSLAPMRMRYTMFTDESGGILDDLMITRVEEGLLVVVNAACKQQDLAYMQTELGGGRTVELLEDRALLALQGPAAVEVMARLAGEAVRTMPFLSAARIAVAGVDCFVTRSGYTGEDGFEISLPAAQAETLARALLAQPEVKPIGLGARNSLRLEAGLCLYGNDIDTHTTPVEAGLQWAIQKVRRTGGARAGGFPGAERVLAQLDGCTPLTRQRVGLVATERVPVREHAPLENMDGQTIGEVTSGLLSPTLNQPIAMGYVPPDYAALGTEVFALVRGKPVPMRVSAMPFVPTRYYRG